MKVTKPLRGTRGAQKLDLSPIHKMIDKAQRMAVYAQVAIVVKPDGEASHFHKTGDDVLVWVQLQPEGHEVQARLAAPAGGPDKGLWRIPAVDAEVMVIMPGGRIDFMPMLALVLSSGEVHERVGDDKTILVAPDEIQLMVGERVVRIAPGSIKLGDAAVEALIKGTTYKTAEQAFLTALNTMFAALNTYAGAIAAIADPTSVATTTLTAAITAMATAINTFSSGQHLSTTVKTE